MRHRFLQRLPQQNRDQERRRHRQAGSDPLIGVGQRCADQPVALRRQRRGLHREQVIEQPVATQLFVAADPMPGQQQLDRLIEQTRLRHRFEQITEFEQRRLGGRFDGQLQLGGQAHGAQHAHRILAVAGLGIADGAQAALVDVLQRADVIDQREVLDAVVQRVDGEVPANHVFFPRAVDVVAQDAIAVQTGVGFVLGLVVRGAIGGHLDDVRPEVHMRQAKAAADQPAVAEGRAHLLGQRAGGDVEVLGRDTQQQIANATADQTGLVTGLVQTVQDVQRALADMRAGNGMFAAGQDAGRAEEGFRHRSRVEGASRGRARCPPVATGRVWAIVAACL